MEFSTQPSSSLAGVSQESLCIDSSGAADLTRVFRGMLRDHGYDTTAASMSLCGNESASVPLDCGSCGETYHVPYHCDNRVCPECGERRRRRVFRRMKERVVDKMDISRCRLTTLTVRNVSPGDLDAAKQGLRDAFSRLRRRDVWGGQDGGVYAIECPYQQDSDSWNLHVHALHEGLYLDEKALSGEWSDITSRVDGVPESWRVGVEFVPDECGGKAGAAGYITGYLTKSPDLWGDAESGSLTDQERAERLFEYHDAFHGANMVQPFGVFHHSSDKAVSLRWVPDEPFPCPECGSDDWVVSGRVCVDGSRWRLWEVAMASGPGPPWGG